MHLAKAERQTKDQVLKTMKCPQMHADEKEWFFDSLAKWMDAAPPGDIFTCGNDGFVVRGPARR
jgi:hypothetical protein